jgi:hypothetical protein
MTDIEAGGAPTLADWAAMQDPAGGIASIANLLANVTPELEDIPWVEGNLPTGHRITQAANSLPSGGWRSLNAGVAVSKGETQQFDESVGMLEANSEVDVALADLNGDAAAFRMAQDNLRLEGLGQQFATALWYESTSTNPERIHGLTPRYPSSSAGTTSAYMTAGTNAGSNAQSIWLIAWEAGKVYGIYPKGSSAGLQKIDHGKERVLDASDNPYRVYSTQFIWKLGIAVEDYRYCVRHQWDPDDAAYADDDRGMYLKMQEMLVTIFKSQGKLAFYMNRTSKKKLDAQLASNDANLLTYISPEGHSGKLIPHFMGVPIRVTDALVAETAAS